MVTAVALLALSLVVALAASRVLGRASHEVESGDPAKHAEVEGIWLRYRVTGTGPPVLLVHGLLSSGRIWEALARNLSRSFTVYSVDLVGFGESDKPLSGYGIRQGSRLLHAFCVRFGLWGASVVGHDIGGDMAAKLAADHPDTVGRIALVAAPAAGEEMDLPTPIWLATRPVLGPLFFALFRAWGFWRRLGLRAFTMSRAVPDVLVEDAAKATPAALSRTIHALRRELSRERLLNQARRIEAPVLLIAGENDEIVDPRSARSWAESVPGARTHLIEDCGHLPMVEAAEEFGEIVLDFLGAEEPPEEKPPEPEADAMEEPSTQVEDSEREAGPEPEEPARREPLNFPEDLFEWPEERRRPDRHNIEDEGAGGRRA